MYVFDFSLINKTSIKDKRPPALWVILIFVLWAEGDSNPWPPPCKGGALTN